MTGWAVPDQLNARCRTPSVLLHFVNNAAHLQIQSSTWKRLPTVAAPAGWQRDLFRQVRGCLLLRAHCAQLNHENCRLMHQRERTASGMSQTCTTLHSRAAAGKNRLGCGRPCSMSASAPEAWFRTLTTVLIAPDVSVSQQVLHNVGRSTSLHHSLPSTTLLPSPCGAPCRTQHAQERFSHMCMRNRDPEQQSAPARHCAMRMNDKEGHLLSGRRALRHPARLGDRHAFAAL